MLGVLMCYLMLQMVLLEGLWSRKEKEQPMNETEEAPITHKKAC